MAQAAPLPAPPVARSLPISGPDFARPDADLIQQLYEVGSANPSATLHKLGTDFERAHPEHRLRISAGSTGKLYAQILHGAPYDVFLSADGERPALLHQQGLADRQLTGIADVVEGHQRLVHDAQDVCTSRVQSV